MGDMHMVQIHILVSLFFCGFFFWGGGVANVVNAAALPVEIVKELV